MTVSGTNPFMEELVLYGLLLGAVLVVSGAAIGFVVAVRRRSTCAQEKNGLFGSMVKMPPASTGLFPVGLYKQTQKSNVRCSANDLSNMEAQYRDAGLAHDSPSLQTWRYETDNEGSLVIGRGVQRWAVHFKMRYDPVIEELEIGLLRVSTIAVPNGNRSIFIFFNISLLPHNSEHKQSSLRHCYSINASFEENFSFRLKQENAASSILRLSLYTVDGNRTRTCLGHVAQPLCGVNIFDGRPHYLTKDLGIFETSNMDGCVGETLVSVCYHMQKEKLKLHVLDSRNLPVVTPTGNKYYFQVDIVVGDRVVKTKRTTTCATLVEVFDCFYAFQIPCRHMDVCCLSFMVVEVITGGGHSKERPWGRFTIGPCSYAHGTGVDHWKMMLSNSRKPIEMWHVISRAY